MGGGGEGEVIDIEGIPEEITPEEHTRLYDKYTSKGIEIVNYTVYRCSPGGNLYFITKYDGEELVILDKPGENTLKVYDKMPPECFDDMGGRSEAVHKYNLKLDKYGGTWTKIE